MPCVSSRLRTPDDAEHAVWIREIIVKGDDAHEIYKWAERNYGKKSIPKWNFHKILINKEGKIEETFSSLTNPNSNKIKKSIEDILN